MPDVKSDEVKQSFDSLEKCRLFTEGNLKLFIHKEFDQCGSLLRKIMELDLPVLDLDAVFLPSPPSQEPIPIIRDQELLNSQPKRPLQPSPFPIYHLWLICLWKRFCLILLQKKILRDVIKTLLLMNICSDQQSAKNQLFLKVTTQ